MKTKPLFIMIYVFTLVITLVNLFFTVKSSLFADINKLPQGKIISTVSSPTGDKVINVYCVENSLGSAVRAEVKTKDKTSNIFWQTGIDSVEVIWANNDVAVINSIPLDVCHGGFYDCRNGVSLFKDGALEGEGFVDQDGNVIPKKY